MANTNDYSEIVKQAEQAVKAVTDPELKRVAFEKILSTLLDSGGTERVTKKKTKSKRGPAASKKKAGGKSQGPKAYIRELKEEGFFSKPKSLPEVKAELENRGHHIAVTSLSGPLQSLCQDRQLRRQKTKASGKGGNERQTYTYAEW